MLYYVLDVGWVMLFVGFNRGKQGYGSRLAIMCRGRISSKLCLCALPVRGIDIEFLICGS